MKLLTKEQEEAHYRYFASQLSTTNDPANNNRNSSVVKGGALGTTVGLVGGTAGVMLAARRYPTIRNLTLPMKSFLVTSAGTFIGIIAADHASRDFDVHRNLERQWYEKRESRLQDAEVAGLSLKDRVYAYAKQEKYKIVGATWVASMIGSFVLVGRNPYLSGQQKIVQARVYAQGLTLAVLVASAGFEISDQRRGKGILDAARREKEAAKETAAKEEGKGEVWKDLVAAEEQRLKNKHQSLYEKPHLHDEHKEQTVKAEGEEKGGQ